MDIVTLFLFGLVICATFSIIIGAIWEYLYPTPEDFGN